MAEAGSISEGLCLAEPAAGTELAGKAPGLAGESSVSGAPLRAPWPERRAPCFPRHQAQPLPCFPREKNKSPESLSSRRGTHRPLCLRRAAAFQQLPSGDEPLHTRSSAWRALSPCQLEVTRCCRHRRARRRPKGPRVRPPLPFPTTLLLFLRSLPWLLLSVWPSAVLLGGGRPWPSAKVRPGGRGDVGRALKNSISPEPLGLPTPPRCLTSG